MHSIALWNHVVELSSHVYINVMAWAIECLIPQSNHSIDLQLTFS